MSQVPSKEFEAFTVATRRNQRIELFIRFDCYPSALQSIF